MSYRTILSSDELADHLDDPEWAIVDCRFNLRDVDAGRRAYEEGHIPGAIYAHLDEDLSSPVGDGKRGRHPLPPVEEFAQTLSRWGIDERVQVVAYDDWGGAIASRLWWMLRWLGHEGVAVLDGGWPLWQSEGRPTKNGVELRSERRFVPRIRSDLVAEAAELIEEMKGSEVALVDARAADRYRGENETLDPKGGHIPGAVNAPFSENLEEGRFRPVEDLQSRYGHLLGSRSPRDVVFYCGSGVTATHNALAMLHAGLGEARIFPGSWSEWVSDESRPVATGEQP